MEEDLSSYRDRKIAFVSDGTGSSIWTVLALILTCLTTQALWYCLPKSLTLRQEPYKAFVIEYAVLVLPWVLVITIFSSIPFLFNVICFLIALSLRVKYNNEQLKFHLSKSSGSESDYNKEDGKKPAEPTSNSTTASPNGTTTSFQSQPLIKETPVQSKHYFDYPHAGHHRSTPSADNEQFTLSRSPSLPASPAVQEKDMAASRDRKPLPYRLFTKPFVSVYRAQMLLLTALCILAVDFPIFPRSYGKCETVGTSLMDIGVGTFVFSFGLVWVLPVLRNQSPVTLSKTMKSAFKKSGPLLLLGFIRLLTVKGVDYHEHVTEYGVHWNFFFTMGVLPLISVPVQKYFSSTSYWKLGVLITILHQIVLKTTRLESWVLSSSRDGIIAQNKEGLASLPGYIAIFMFGADAGMYILPPDPYFAYRDWSKGSKTPFKPKLGKLATVLAGYAIIWWISYILVNYIGHQPVSRQLANISYVFWVAAMNVSALLGLLAVQISLGSGSSNVKGNIIEVPYLVEAINRNGLLFFLIANVATGAVNVTINTVDTSNLLALFVLIIYSLTLSFFARTWKSNKSTIKTS